MIQNAETFRKDFLKILKIQFLFHRNICRRTCISIGDLKGKLLGNELESSQVSKRYGLQQVRLIEDTDIVIMEKVERFM